MGVTVLFLTFLLLIGCGWHQGVTGVPVTSTVTPPSQSPVAVESTESPTTSSTSSDPVTATPDDQDSNREPDNADASPMLPTDELPTPLLLRPGNRFFYHVPISPETDFSPLYWWKLRGRPAYDGNGEVVVVPWGGPRSGDVDKASVNVQREQGPHNDGQEEEEEAATAMGEESAPRESDVVAPSVPEVPPFGEDRPAFRFPLRVIALDPSSSSFGRGPEDAQQTDDGFREQQPPLPEDPSETEAENPELAFEDNVQQQEVMAQQQQQPEEEGERAPVAEEQGSQAPEQQQQQEQEQQQEQQPEEGEPSAVGLNNNDGGGGGGGERTEEEELAQQEDMVGEPQPMRFDDGSKWFADPQPFFDFGNDPEIPAENMVESEMELRRGNFDRAIP